MSIWYFVVGLVLFIVGCGGKDMAQTPQTPQSPQTNNSPPSIRINDAAFVPTSGTVRVQWVQTNADAVTGYVLERKLSKHKSFSPIIKTTASALTPTNTNVLSLQDTSVFAGEQTLYRIAAETSDGKMHYSNDVSVIIPGARFERADLNRENATMHLQWRADMEQALSYEIVRQADDNLPEVVFVARDPTTTVFEDGPLQGNVRYSYQVRTVLKNGARIRSQSDTLGFYLSRRTVPVTNASGYRFRLVAFQDPNQIGATVGALVYVFDKDKLELHKIWYYNHSSSTRNYFTRSEIQSSKLELNSVSVTGYAVHTGYEFAKNYIVGIHPETRELIIQMYSEDGAVLYTWTSAPEKWRIGLTYQRTSVAQDREGNLFVAAGGILKVFSVHLVAGAPQAALKELGKVSIPTSGDIGDLVVVGASVFLTLPEEDKLLKGQIQFASDGSLQTVAWQDVTPSGVRPDALTVNFQGRVLTLDLYHGKVWVLGVDGNVITDIVLKGTDFNTTGRVDGDLVAGWSGAGDILYVSNASGQILLLTTE